MSLKSIIAMPVLLFAAATAAEAADKGSYAGSHALYQDVTIPPAQGPVPVPYPNATAKGATEGTPGASVTLQRLANPSLPAGQAAGSGHTGGMQVGLGDGSVRQVRDGTSNTLMVGERTTGASKPPSPSGPQNYGHVPPGVAGPAGPGNLAAEQDPSAIGLLLPAVQSARESADRHRGTIEVDSFSLGATQNQEKPGAKKVKNPSGGTKLPAVQKVRDAANRTPSQQAGKGEIEIQSWSQGGSQAQTGPGGCDAACTNNLKKQDGDGAGKSKGHAGGANFLFADGSVRSVDSPVGGNETLTVGGGRTEAPKGTSLGSLTGVTSINRLAAPKGDDAAAGGQVRIRSFALVDRTNATAGGTNGGAAGGTDAIVTGAGPGAGPQVKVFDGRAATLGAGPQVKVFDGRSAATPGGPTQGGGPHVKAFDSPKAAPAADMVLKGQKIKQN